jgi:hypothetical protein
MASLLHLFRYLVLMDCRVFCNQETGKSEMERPRSDEDRY